MKKIILLFLISGFVFGNDFTGIYILEADDYFIPRVLVINTERNVALIQEYDFRRRKTPITSLGILQNMKIKYVFESSTYIIKWDIGGNRLLDYSEDSETGDNVYRRITDEELLKLSEYEIPVPSDGSR